MSNRISRSSPVNTSELDVHLAEFLATLAKAGYAVTTQHDKRRAISPFIRWVRDAQIAVAELDEARIGVFLAHRSRRRRKRRDPAIRTRAQRCCNFSSTFGLSGSCHRANRSSRQPSCSFRGTSIISVTTEGFAPARLRSTRRSFAHSSLLSGSRRPSWPSTHRRSAATFSAKVGLARSRS